MTTRHEHVGHLPGSARTRVAGGAEMCRPIWIVRMILDSGEVNRLGQRLDLPVASVAGPFEAGDEIVSFNIGLV